MVYCGKPSMGCAQCRRRKTRCDKARPSCGQCIRADRECPGYRNQLDLMFRSENRTVIGKVKVREAAKATIQSPKSDTSADIISEPEECAQDTEDLDATLTIAKYSPIYAENAGGSLAPSLGNYILNPTIEERGRGFFSAHSSMWLRNYDIVDDLCIGGKEDKVLLASITAVGLASYAHSVQAINLFKRARTAYVEALKLTNAALRSPIDARKDSTLLSVTILSIFEMVTGANEDSLTAWVGHINGASTLIKMRGPDQLRTKAGQQLFGQVTSNIMITCVLRTIKIPDHIMELHKIAGQFAINSVWAAWDVCAVVFDCANLRAAIRDCEIVGPKSIIEAALKIDQRFLAVFADVPESWKYETSYTDQDDECIWKGRVDVYHDFWIPQIWNGMRICRILLHEIISDQLMAAATALTPIFTAAEMQALNYESNTTMLSMQADILASIPSYLPRKFDNASTFVGASRGSFVLWPLYVAAMMDIAMEATDVHTWVIGRLRAIASGLGIQQAALLAHILEQHRDITGWDRKPVPRLKKDAAPPTWTPASGTGTVRTEWWDIDSPERAGARLMRL